MPYSKLGLVLSGGGAKGAYQVGVIRYLAEQNIEIDVISGASIGALNAALVSTSSTLKDAAHKMNALWQDIVRESPLKINRADNSRYLVGSTMIRLFGKQASSNISIFDHYAIEALLERNLSAEALKLGKPLWVSLYESGGALSDLSRVVLDELGIVKSKSSIFLEINKLPEHERIKALMASAAIPIAFKAHVVEGQTYTDGGLGGWSQSQGNTPIEPLITSGCTHAIVTYLSDGSFVDRSQFSPLTILEIRPSGIDRQGGLKDVLAFPNSTSLESWIAQGYEDAKRCVGNALKTLHIRTKNEKVHHLMKEAVRSLDEDEFHIE